MYDIKCGVCSCATFFRHVSDLFFLLLSCYKLFGLGARWMLEG